MLIKLNLTLLETLGLTIKRVQYRNYRVLDAALAPSGITLVQWCALREIAGNPGLCMHELSERTFNSDQAFGTLMTRLLRMKLVQRHAGVGRANVHRLTARGETLLAEGRKIVREMLAETFAGLSAGEQAQLLTLLDKALGAELGSPTATMARPRNGTRPRQKPGGRIASARRIETKKHRRERQLDKL